MALGRGLVEPFFEENRAVMSLRQTEKILAAPEALSLETRTAFRRTASELLDQLPEGTGRLVIDLSGTRTVDSAGLGALMLIQRKAAERPQIVCLPGSRRSASRVPSCRWWSPRPT